MIVYMVYVLEDDFHHVFSTKEKASAFADSKDCPCVICDYLVDDPDRFYKEFN